MFINQN